MLSTTSRFNFRSFSTSVCLCGRRTKKPFDSNFPVTAKHVNEKVKGGNQELARKVALHVVPQAGYIDKRNLQYRIKKEMVPEFVVPDLTGFKLKAYVPYSAPEITQTKFTAKDLFDAVYAPEIARDYDAGRIKLKDGKVIVDKKS